MRIQRFEGSGLAADLAASEAPLAGEVWPERWRAPGAEDPKGVIVEESRRLDGLFGMFFGEHHRFRPSARDYADANALARRLGVAGSFRFKPEGGGGMVFVPRHPDWPKDPRLDGPEPAFVFKFVSGRSEPAAGRGLEWLRAAGKEHPLRGLVGPLDPLGGPDAIALQRTWFAFYEPADRASRGLVVILPGLFGMPGWYIEPLTRDLNARGYAVLRMLALPSRFLQGAELVADAAREHSLPEGFAGMVTDRLAEVAYAVEAAREHVERRRPELAGAPAALVGMSGGALAAPAAWARAPEAWDAVVLIAGGADFAELGATSAFADALLKVGLRTRAGEDGVPGRRAEEEAIEQARSLAEIVGGFGDAYLASSPLDPYNVAPRLAGEKVLLIHAARDRVVPAATGDQLWRRLGAPERWVYPVGHGLLFLALPFQIDRFVSWIDGALTPGEEQGYAGRSPGRGPEPRSGDPVF